MPPSGECNQLFIILVLKFVVNSVENLVKILSGVLLFIIKEIMTMKKERILRF